MSKQKPKSKKIGVLLSLFFGGIGLHRFYLNQYWLGFAYAVFWFTMVPSLLGIIEAFFMPDRVEKFNLENDRNNRTNWLKSIGLASSGFFMIFIFAFLLFHWFSNQFEEALKEGVKKGEKSQNQTQSKELNSLRSSLKEKDAISIGRDIESWDKKWKIDFFRKLTKEANTNNVNTFKKLFTERVNEKIEKEEVRKVMNFLLSKEEIQRGMENTVTVKNKNWWLINLLKNEKRLTMIVLRDNNINNYKIDGFSVENILIKSRMQSLNSLLTN